MVGLRLVADLLYRFESLGMFDKGLGSGRIGGF